MAPHEHLVAHVEVGEHKSSTSVRICRRCVYQTDLIEVEIEILVRALRVVSGMR